MTLCRGKTIIVVFITFSARSLSFYRENLFFFSPHGPLVGRFPCVFIYLFFQIFFTRSSYSYVYTFILPFVIVFDSLHFEMCMYTSRYVWSFSLVCFSLWYFRGTFFSKASRVKGRRLKWTHVLLFYGELVFFDVASGKTV